LPAGDSWLVYPKDGKLIDSIRYEAMRDGIADYELLSMLSARNPKAAMALAEKLILAFDRYVIDALVDGCGKLPKLLGTALRPAQNGLVQLYALLMMIGLFVLLGALLL